MKNEKKRENVRTQTEETESAENGGMTLEAGISANSYGEDGEDGEDGGRAKHDMTRDLWIARCPLSPLSPHCPLSPLESAEDGGMTLEAGVFPRTDTEKTEKTEGALNMA